MSVLMAHTCKNETKTTQLMLKKLYRGCKLVGSKNFLVEEAATKLHEIQQLNI